ncbi:MAG: phosphatidate cytidylyltransferase [Eubacteriaceae bacterium]|nr:phosphatidate cytidylyltransferase [Eubacteriaceae bacterium]
MKQRIITALIIAAIAAAIAYLGIAAMCIFIVLVSVVALCEYSMLVYQKNAIDIAFSAIGGALLVSLPFFFSDRYLLAVYTAGLLLLFVKDILRGRADIVQTVLGIWGYSYVSLFSSLAASMLLFDYNLFWIISAATVICDIFAYLGGSAFGKHKIAPNISPKKTLEGSITGFAVSFAAFEAGGYFFAKHYSWPFLVTAGVMCALLSEFGDLAASMAKRHYGVKDYSSLLPGHGGVLDRIDSLLFSFASAYCLLYFFGYK